jgi:putative oxidoreductase
MPLPVAERESDPSVSWSIRLAVAVIFVLTGVEKFAATGHWIQVFDQIGAGQWFRYATGAIEMMGGLLFLVPAATTLGAFLLAATMAGAMLIHVAIFHHPADALFPAAYLAGVLLAWRTLRTRK